MRGETRAATRKASIAALAILSMVYLFLWPPLLWLGLKFFAVPMSLRFAAIVAALFMVAAPAALIGFLWWLACRDCPQRLPAPARFR